MSSNYSLEALRSDATQLWANQPVPKNVTDPEAYKAARGFEAYFARYLINQLKGDMNLVGGKGYGGEIYQDMYVESLASKIASTGSLGIAEMIYRQLMQKKGEEPFKADDQKLNPLQSIQKLSIPFAKDGPPVSLKMIRYHDYVSEAANRFGLEPELIYAVMQQESGGDTNAVSKAGAKGLMQLMDTTAEQMGVRDAFDPRDNIIGGAKYLRAQLDRFGNLDTALAAYNAGPTAVSEYGGVPPFKETQDYVRNVSSIYGRLKQAVQQQADKQADRSGDAERTSAASRVLQLSKTDGER